MDFADRLARETFMKELRNILRGVETWVSEMTDEFLAWHGIGPGSETDITAEQMDWAIARLQRVRDLIFSDGKRG
jgi:hypothetical protein